MRLTTSEADWMRHFGVRSWWPLRFRSWSDPRWEPDPWPTLFEFGTSFGVRWDDPEFVPWARPTSGREVDLETTELMRSKVWDEPVRSSAGLMRENVLPGHPLQRVDGCELVDVVDQHGRKHRVPLPAGTVRRFGDPTGILGDSQWIGVDFERRRYYEAGALRRSLFGTWHAQAVVSFDLDEGPLVSPRRGLAAGRMPMALGIPHPLDLLAGRMRRGIFMAAGRYRPRDVVGYAAATDGAHPGAPLVSGLELALRSDWSPKFPLSVVEGALVAGLKEFPVVVNDRTDPDQGSRLRLPMDPRITIRDLGLRLSDFVALRPA